MKTKKELAHEVSQIIKKRQEIIITEICHHYLPSNHMKLFLNIYDKINKTGDAININTVKRMVMDMDKVLKLNEEKFKEIYLKKFLKTDYYINGAYINFRSLVLNIKKNSINPNHIKNITKNQKVFILNMICKYSNLSLYDLFLNLSILIDLEQSQLYKLWEEDLSINYKNYLFVPDKIKTIEEIISNPIDEEEIEEIKIEEEKENKSDVDYIFIESEDKNLFIIERGVSNNLTKEEVAEFVKKDANIVVLNKENKIEYKNYL